MRYIVAGILGLFIAGQTWAQGAGNQVIVSPQSKSSRIVAPAAPAVQVDPLRTFHVARTRLFMDWRAPLDSMSIRFHGVNELTLRIVAPTVNVVLDGAGISIDSVLADGVLVTATQPGPNEHFSIALDRQRAPGDSVVLTVAYTRISGSAGVTTADSIPGIGFNLYNKGLYVGPSAWGDSVFIPERLAYTMSEPRDAHWWMPCVDDPSEKAPAEMRVLVPPGYSVASNGLLRSETTTAAGTLFDWVENEPIAPYLMAATASKFARWTDKYVRVSNPADTVPIMYFTWRVDSSSADISGREYNASYSFRNLPAIMTGFSERFGEYPFTKYGMVPVQPFDFGGMEHQTMTTINRVWLRGSYERYIAHELTHQWFGDHVTCGTWKDMWLNEGFATFGEAIYSEIMGGPDAYSSVVDGLMSTYLKSRDSAIAIYDAEGQGRNVFNGATVYTKGGIVVHMLRRILEDSLFFNTLQAYQQHFAYGAATTQDLADFVSQHTGQDLHYFFNEWVFGRWHPKYLVDAVFYSGDVRELRVTISQDDSLLRPLFRMPVLLRIYSGVEIIDAVVVDSMRVQTFDFSGGSLPYLSRVDSVAFDPLNSVLKDSTVLSFRSIEVGVASGAPVMPGAPAIRVSPNPATDQATIQCIGVVSAHNLVEVCDVLGRVVTVFPEHPQSNSRFVWNTRAVPAGTYLARLSGITAPVWEKIRVVH